MLAGAGNKDRFAVGGHIYRLTPADYDYLLERGWMRRYGKRARSVALAPALVCTRRTAAPPQWAVHVQARQQQVLLP